VFLSCNLSLSDSRSLCYLIFEFALLCVFRLFTSSCVSNSIGLLFLVFVSSFSIASIIIVIVLISIRF
jgi:hypothetical protein